MQRQIKLTRRPCSRRHILVIIYFKQKWKMYLMRNLEARQCNYPSEWHDSEFYFSFRREKKFPVIRRGFLFPLASDEFAMFCVNYQLLWNMLWLIVRSLSSHFPLSIPRSIKMLQPDNRLGVLAFAYPADPKVDVRQTFRRELIMKSI